MKKLITILVASIFTVSSIFAAGTLSQAGDTTAVKLLGHVDEITYSAQLKYNEVSVFDQDVLNEDARFDLTTSSQSQDFSIHFTSNYVETQQVGVTVSSTAFTRDAGQELINTNSGTQKTSLATTVEEFNANNLLTIPNGLISDYEAERFHIGWTPDTTLASGEYTSTITVSYTAI